MPGRVVHLGTAMVCTHGGQARPLGESARVTIGGLPVVTTASTVLVAGCPHVDVAPSPCTTARWVTGSSRVTVLGAPLVLADSISRCEPHGSPLVVVAAQHRVTAR
jgi:hypothetical protein